ncbi:MAG: cytochrome c [Rhodospirillales bacterium]|nr:cytochrome c [Rhodospirillales bacterium]
MGRTFSVLVAITLLAGTAVARADPLSRGNYLFDAAGCAGCHTDKKNKGQLLAGGRALKTPFGIFYAPNITPDPVYGIGGWSDQDFLRAMRQGIAPDGSHYFPVFPYAAYTGLNDRDILDIKAYIFSLPPSRIPNKPHQADPPFGWRFLVGIWKALYFRPGPLPAETGRGEYLARALGHCGECHTPRNFLGGFKNGMDFAGTAQGPEGGVVPNLTPDRETGIGKWSESDLESLLTLGMLPDGDFVGGGMGEVIDNTTSRLKKSDLAALISYFRSLAPVRNQVLEPTKPKNNDRNW